MFIEVNGLKLYYQIKGTGGKVLILLHGNEEDGRIFKGIERYLDEKYTLYILDSRGHGQSGQVDILRYEDMASDLICFVDALQLDKPAVFGYSDGGNVALSAAVREPDLFSTILVAGANTTQEGLGAYLEPMKKEFEQTLSKYIDLMLSGPNLSTQELKCIQSKVIVLRGEHDLIDRQHTIYFTKAIPNAKYIELKGEDHGSYVLDLSKLSNLIHQYID